MEYTVRSAHIQPDLQGAWSGLAWEKADTLIIANFRPESSDHRPRTFAKLLYNKEGFFGIFLVKDRYVQCVHTHYMDPVYEDSCVEFFVQPRLDKGYFNFEFNCGGSLLCSYIVDPTKVPNGFKDFTPLPEEDGKQVVIHHSMPKIVKPEITVPVEWILEFFIPFALLDKYVEAFGRADKQEWRANFFKCADGTSHPHWASWAPVDELNFHLPDNFGTLRFD